MKLRLADVLKKYARTIHCIRRLSPCGRVDIANALNFSWTAADNHIKDLLKEGVLREVEGNRFEVIPELAYCVGIAVGTRSIKVSIVDFAFHPIPREALSEFALEALEQRSDMGISLFCYPSAQNIDELTERLNEILKIVLDSFDKNGKTLFAVTLAFPGAVDVKQQKIIACPNIGCLTGKSVSTLIYGTLLNRMREKEISLLVENNAKTALIAEREHLYQDEDPTRRSLAGMPNIAVVYGGTGLGCGISLEYRLQRGTNFAGELGHMVAPDYQVPPKERTWPGEQPAQVRCSCTSENCLEQLIRTRVFGALTPEAYVGRTREDILQRFRLDHAPEYKVFLQYAGCIVNHLINLLDLDVLIFTGRLFAHMDGFADHLNMLKGKYTLTYTGDTCTVLLGWKRADIAAIGAAMEGFLTNGGREQSVQWQSRDGR